MKKILFFFGVVTLIEISTTNLIACNKPDNNTLCEKENNGNWKQLCSNNKPFDIKDDKWYLAIWRGDIDNDWKIDKFINWKSRIFGSDTDAVDDFNFYSLIITDLYVGRDLTIIRRKDNGDWIIKLKWQQDDGNHFKAVYRWDGTDLQPRVPIIDPKTGEVTDWSGLKNVKEEKEVEVK